MAECACCGQTLPEQGPPGLKLRGIRRLIYDRVRLAGENGVRADNLFAFLYDGDPDGGPLTGTRIIAVHVWHANQMLRKFGQAIVGGRTGGGAFANYRLVALHA